MNEDYSEEELIKLSEILETLKKDALEVTDLLVTGIDYYRLLGYIFIAVGVFSAWNVTQYVYSGDMILGVVWAFFTGLSFFGVPLFFYRNRRLKKKYKELIDIHKSLTED